MNAARIEQITAQIYDLTRDLALDGAVTWDDVLHVHKAIAIGFGAACGRAYANCPTEEAKLNTALLISTIDQAAQLGYEVSQTQVAEWRLDQIAKEAANGPRD